VNENKHTKHTKVKVQTIMKLNLIPIGFSLAVATALGVSTLSSHAQVSATATFTDTPGTGGSFDYTVTLNNTGTEAIEGFWMGWVPGVFDVASPTPVSNSLNWNSAISEETPSASSIQYGGSSTETLLGAGDSATFSFDTTTTPTDFETVMDNAGASTVYGADATQQFAFGLTASTSDTFDLVQSVPEPSSFAFFGAGLIAFLFVLRRKQSFAAARGH
jgi:PEP-CTERM motif